MSAVSITSTVASPEKTDHNLLTSVHQRGLTTHFSRRICGPRLAHYSPPKPPAQWFHPPVCGDSPSPSDPPLASKAWPLGADRDSGTDRLKRAFGIDIETCSARGGALRIIACIEDPAVIKKILAHLDKKEACTEPARLPPCRAPPQAGLFA